MTPALAARSGVIGIVTAVIVGNFFTHPDYSWVSHTTSELAGQNMPNAWIMRAGFVAYGLGVAMAAARAPRMGLIERVAYLVFGAGFVGTALWPHVHIHPALGGDLGQDFWHSVFASTIGTAFSIACAARLFLPGGNRRDWAAWAGLVAAMAIPLLMFNITDIAGILQRGMFAISFIVVWRRFG